jgi:CDP-glycerol glycerophosphotransferase
VRTAGRVSDAARAAGYAVLRRAPRTRLAVRHAYWALQKRKYDALAKSIATEARTVLFEAYGGRSYACSPKALYQEMLGDERFAGCELVWAFREGAVPSDEPDLEHATIVKRGSSAYFETLARAGCIVVNNRLPEYVYPKDDQVYVQCWHGTPLKRLGYDVEIEMESALNTTNELAERFGMDARKWTHLLSPSPYASKHLADAFGLPLEKRGSVIVEEGYPRNDALVRSRGDESVRARLRDSLGVPEGKRVLLYAPTWRDDSYQDGVGYTFDYLLDFDLMRQQLGDEWVVLFRPHYYIANQFDFSAYEGFVIDVSKVDDVNDLYLASDVLLTDYSSVMFDYANLRRPIVLFVPDRERYADAIRGFYFDLEEVPGPLCSTTDEVVEELTHVEGHRTKYEQAYAAFVEKFCPLDDGCACARVLERLASFVALP